MFAMQYAIDLPADYDMEIIRRRVRDNGDKTDGFRDLEMKAYLIAEKGKYGNARNQYAPFYVWRAVEGMNEFLLHGPYNNILQSFGWPRIQTWFVIQTTIRKIASSCIARVDIEPIVPFTDFDTLVADEAALAKEIPASTSLVSAYNPYGWELCRFCMLERKHILEEEIGAGLIYDIHHIS